MLRDDTVVEFCEKLASSDPVPGGGAVAALCSAVSCSLASMVARLTDGKKGYEEAFDQVRSMVPLYEEKSRMFLSLMEQDVEAFDRVMAAYGMPKSTDEEKKVRSASIQNALKGAAEVPLRVAEASAELFDALEYLVKHGNKNAQSDALVGTMMARNAVIGALFNVQINLDSIKDEDYVVNMRAKVEELRKIALERENKIVFGGKNV